ncbi:hypothetical protein [Allofournierella massiliensis]|uniref:hypothetical protein n=1 Tax=Allofournierella massiliensis TaxID=1650663 RepID=UPI0024B0CE80|nr:hypothetical protein [Fournierella massiliensis]
MAMDWLNVAKSILDNDDYYTSGLRAVQKEYYDTKKRLRKITTVLLILCIASIAAVYFFVK